MRQLVALVVMVILLTPLHATAWGGSGHRMIGQAAMMGLPADLPEFLRTNSAVAAIGELSREPDRWKGAGKVHDQGRDPGHFVDLADDGTILGGPRLGSLPATRKDYETALRAAGTNSWDAGYLPYAILDQFQQLTRDFAFWRVLTAAERLERNPERRAWLVADRLRRQTLMLGTLGQLSHYVADGSQPLHVTVHYNGWGDFPNPSGFTLQRVHGPFESDFVAANLRLGDVRSAIQQLHAAGSPEVQISDYLLATAAQVGPFYQLEKLGAFRGADPQGIAFAKARLGAGASELLFLVLEAWKASPGQTVGWPAVSLVDVEAGRADAYLALYSKD